MPSNNSAVPTSGLCVLCQSATKVWEVIRNIPVDECTLCHHRQARISTNDSHLAEVYGDSYFSGGGSGYVDYLSEGTMLRKRGVKYARILRKHIPTGSFLDVGSAAGFIVEGMVSMGWKGIGLEPNDAMATHGRSRGFEIRTGSFGSNTTQQLSGIGHDGTAPRFDAVLMIQVIAHLGDPKDAIHQAHQLLRPGGVLLIETWDRASLMARATKLRWHEYSPPSVVHWFTKAELDSCADSLGFTRIARGLMPKWITAEHATSLLQSGRASVPISAKIAAAFPAKFALPYPGDDLFWVLYQRGVD